MIKKQREIYMELISNDTMKSKSIEAINSCRYVSTMCYLKVEILLQLQEKTKACEWLRVALLLLNNAQLHMKFLNYFGKLVGNPPDISCRSVSTHKLPSFLAVNNSLIRYALMLAEESPSERKQIFILLYVALTRNIKCPSHYLGKAMKMYPQVLTREAVMPFITFFVKTSEESSQQEMKQMLLFKNSLIIMDHFKMHLHKSQRKE